MEDGPLYRTREDKIRKGKINTNKYGGRCGSRCGRYEVHTLNLNNVVGVSTYIEHRQYSGTVRYHEYGNYSNIS